jgi:DNA-binding FadR family transcriptional regulator
VVASWRERAGLEMLGTLVRGLKLADPAWHELVRSALELRRILASEAVALAAERHTDDDIDAIATCAQVLREHVDDPLAFARADLAFMRAVCRAGRNVGLELFLNTFARWPDEHPQLVTVLYDDTAASVTLYDPVIEVIKSRDSEGARMAARRALELLDKAWARRHPPPAPVLSEPANEIAPAPPAKGRTAGPAQGSKRKADGDKKP